VINITAPQLTKNVHHSRECIPPSPEFQAVCFGFVPQIMEGKILSPQK
jgi:hypothetical protein